MPLLSSKIRQFLQDEHTVSEVAEIMAGTVNRDFCADNGTDFDVNDKFELVYVPPGKMKRNVLRPGKLAALILPDAAFTPLQIEAFVTEWKAYFSLDGAYPIEIVSGQKLLEGYNTTFYSESGNHYENGPLWNSCMRNMNKSTFELYTANPDVCSMAIMRNAKGDNGIVARALVWKLNSGRTLMDRVYYTRPECLQAMLNYAKEQGWLRKHEQNAESKRSVTDGKTTEYDASLDIDFQVLPSRFPYLDTFSWLLVKEKKLVNKKPSSSVWHYGITDTGGSFSDYQPIVMVFSTYLDYEIEQKDGVFSEVIDSWLFKSMAVQVPIGDIDGSIWYPLGHDDLCVAYSIANMNAGERRQWLLRANCLQDEAGYFFEKGHPRYFQPEGRGWVEWAQLKKFDKVMDQSGRQGLWSGDILRPLLPETAEILTAFNGDKFIRGDKAFGFYQKANDQGEMMTRWMARYGVNANSDWKEVNEDGTEIVEQTPLIDGKPTPDYFPGIDSWAMPDGSFTAGTSTASGTLLTMRPRPQYYMPQPIRDASDYLSYWADGARMGSTTITPQATPISRYEQYWDRWQERHVQLGHDITLDEFGEWLTLPMSAGTSCEWVYAKRRAEGRAFRSWNSSIPDLAEVPRAAPVDATEDDERPF